LGGISRRHFEVLFGDFAEARSRNFQEAINEEELAEDYGYLSDSDLEDEDDELSIPRSATTKDVTKDTIQPGVGLPSSPATSNENERVYEDYEECIEQGKVVKIPDMAFVT
jgi:hypothetical protein